MKIIQLSDFHFTQDSDIEECKLKIDKLFDSIAGNLEVGEQIVFCVCGDITDSGNDFGYTHAQVIMDYIFFKFSRYKINYEFIPGNHDICGDDCFGKFDGLIEKYITAEKYRYKDNNVVKREYGDIELFLINSAFHGEYTHGFLDFEQLIGNMNSNGKAKILVMHHALLSWYGDDGSPMRRAQDVIKLLQENNVIALLHGHTHGYGDIKIAGDCRVIGVGPMFKKVDDVNNQFNLIEIAANKVHKIINFRYSADLHRYDPLDVYQRKYNNIFQGENTSSLYKEILSEVKSYSCIHNFHMNVNCSCADFLKDIEENFQDYISIAEQWQADELPENLYYNHGQHMNTPTQNGIEYIFEELGKKATSSRAMLPLISLPQVISSGDDFLPSLDIIQFGFHEESKSKLYITIYLRALEVNHFLKINLSEIYVMTKKLTGKFRSIRDVDLTVLAFKAQFKEEFSCFQKADIDKMNERDIMLAVLERDIGKILAWIDNKKSLSETVVKEQGLINLSNCLKTYSQSKKDGYYSTAIISKMEAITGKMISLKKERETNSDYGALSTMEAEVNSYLDDIREEFNRLALGEKR